MKRANSSNLNRVVKLTPVNSGSNFGVLNEELREASNILLQITLFAQIENDFCRRKVWLMLTLDFTHNSGVANVTFGCVVFTTELCYCCEVAEVIDCF